jgi:hypothetical protein
MPDQITKAAFLAGVRCLTEGWRTLRADRGSITPALEWRFHVGAEVGRLAQAELGAGRILLRTPVDKAAAESAAAIAAPDSTLLFEATLLPVPFVARADALRRNGAAWDLIEVKSGKGRGEDQDAKEDQIDDLAYTTMVAQRAGLPLARLVLMLINPEYRLNGSAPLMVLQDVTDTVLQRAAEFTGLAPMVAQALLSPVEPPAELKLVCKDCEYFRDSCLGAGIPDPLFDIPRLSAKKFEEMKSYGRVSAIPPSVKLTEIQGRVARVIRSGRPEVDLNGLEPLSRIEWPACYLDFEGVAPALPWFEDAVPYDQIPFQYSLHRCDGPGQVVDHRFFLADNEGDWRTALCEQLLDELGERGPIVVYSPYEKRTLNYLARVRPAFATRLELAVARLFDLEPVVRKGYCHPGFHGHSGIKYVLPVMVPSLGYAPLDIQGGEDAAGVFALMRIGKYDGSPTSKHRQQLLDYCQLDTLAMVRVHEALIALSLKP